MANPQLQQQFIDALQSSKSFQLLNAEEQAALKNAFANATDAQLAQGLQELQNDAAATAKLDADIKKRNEELVKKAKEIKATLKEINKTELKEAEVKENADSVKAAEMLLATIGQTGDEKKNRKKFLGIF